MREEKPYFSAVVEIWMAFGITRAVFSFVIACTLWKGIVSFGERGERKEEGEIGRREREGNRERKREEREGERGGEMEGSRKGKMRKEKGGKVYILLTHYETSG